VLVRKDNLLIAFENVVDRAGVSNKLMSDRRGAGLDIGDEFIVNMAIELDPKAIVPLIIGLGSGRASMVRERSRVLECKGWLGLGNRHGWSEGRRGGE